MADTPANTGEQQGLGGDIWGGLASMLVTLPASIAFGVLVFTSLGAGFAGQGAVFGALGAAALGLVAPLAGRNGGFVTAPCAPAAAVLSGFAATLVASGGASTERIVALMALAALVSALLQVGYGVLRLGRFIKYIPYQVVTGYLSGVALIIAVAQIPRLLGAPAGTGLLDTLTQPALWRWQGIAVGAVTIVVMGNAARLTARVPASILGLGAGLVAYFALAALDPTMLATAGNPLVIGPLDAAGSLGDVVRRGFNGLAGLQLADVGLVFATGATLSALLSIDTLKTGVVLDALMRRRHDSNRELLAQGLANLFSALMGGMPGAGTMGPTLVNVSSGGRSPLSGFAEGVFVVLALLLLGSLIAWVPIAALAGILLVVAWRMFDWKVFSLVMRPATRLDFVVIATVVLVAKTIGLIEASAAGIALAILLFIRDQIRGSVIVRKRDLRGVSSKTLRTLEERELLDRNAELGLLVELRDNLFFGTTDQMFSDLMHDLDHRLYLLLDLRRVRSTDYTAVHLFHLMQQRLAEHGGGLLLSGMPSGSTTGLDIERYLKELGLVSEGNDGARVFESRNEGLAWIEERVLERAGWINAAAEPPLTVGGFELFREFDAAALARIEAILEPVHLDAGERLFARGDMGDHLYLVRKGVVDIFLPLPENKRHHLETVSRGGYFGEMSFLDYERRSADAMAKTEVELYAVSRYTFNKLALEDSIIGIKVFARLALMVSRRLRSADAELLALEQR